jgi:hypothetical protein
MRRPCAPSVASGRSGKSGGLLPARRRVGAALLSLLLVGLAPGASTLAAQLPTDLVAYVERRLGLSEPQVRGALGALLVYARQRLQKTEFDALAANVPNAQWVMQDVKGQGIVTHPLDSLDDYEKALSNVGIGQPLASEVVPAVLEYLGATGHDVERDILEGILN